MAANVVTLEFGAVEKSLADWGFELDSAQGEFRAQSMDTLRLTLAGALVTDDPLMAFETAVILRLGRTGAGTAYADGYIEFQGKRLTTILDGRPEFEGCIYEFGGPWYDLQATPFQQTIQQWVGPGSTLGSILQSDTVLFQKMTAPGVIAQRNTGQQITDILQHLLDMYTAQALAAPYQIGTIGVAVNQNTYPVRDIKCSEAIEVCLRSSPDSNLWFDYTTTPPTVNVTKRASATGVSKAIKNGTDHRALNLIPRPDLQARSVVLYFKQTSQENGFSWVTFTKQKYPALGVEGGLRVIVETIDLQGLSRTDVFGHLDCSTADPTNAAWWPRYYPPFADASITGLTINSATVKDESGATISLGTYPNVLDHGDVAAWMTLAAGTPVTSIKAVITAQAEYTKTNAATGAKEKYKAAVVTARVELTNGITGDYRAVASYVDPEAIPTGLAQSIYDSLSALQYSGSDLRVEDPMTHAFNMGNVLNLTGGRAEWATMNAQLQSIRRHYGSGETLVNIGPAKFLSAGDMTQIFLVNRFRRVFYDPNIQGSAQVNSSANSVQFAKNSTKENTQAENIGSSIFEIGNVAAGVTTKISHDAESQWVKLTQSGTAPQPSVLIDLPTLGTRAAGWVWLHFKDPTDCSAKKMLVLGTAPEAE